jgi:crossover junction endodeoxyribonuclease RuvC
MRLSESARAAPANDAARDPHNDLLSGKIERTGNLFECGQQAGAFVLGVDIGASGAVAVLSKAGELVAVEDMPTLADGPAGRRAVNPALLADIIARSQASKAYVELVGARPGEGAASAFAFGRARGVVEGLLASLAVASTQIAPASWKRAVGVPPGRDGAKDAARSEAIRRWPAKAALFARAKDDGRAEAALIALAGLKRREGGL